MKNHHSERRLPMPERFWVKVKRGGPDECWPWLASRRDPDGYGAFRLNDKQNSAHRVAFILAGGSLPPGALVLHRCDNPPCCNPRHLFAGDQAANIADKVAKGRQAKGPRKLTQAQIDAIRQACPRPGERFKWGTGTELAAQFGISRGYLHTLRTRPLAADAEMSGEP